jgi:predicted TIM-barrel fold metal-dependent hydrolase
MRSPIPIFDCHGHLGTHPDFPAWKQGYEDMLQVMDLLNVEVLAITSTLACSNDCPRGNAEVAEVLRKYPQRFRGYITVNPRPPGEALGELERWSYFHRPPLIKLHPECHQYPVDGDYYRPIWDYANQTHAVVLVHTWDSDPKCGPLLLGPIAHAFPQAKIILGHSGVTWRGYEQSFTVAADASNTFLDITGSQSHRTIIERAVARLGAHRVLFGSDMPYLEAAMVLGRLLSARISDEDREKILRGNFARLLEEGNDGSH